MNDSERPSSARWSVGQSPCPPSGHQAPASWPADSGLRWRAGPPSVDATASSTDGGGHAGSATHRPGRVAWWPAGGTQSCIQASSFGSSITPFSRPLSQWSNQRTHSCRKPITGPGSPSCGNACDHGPISPRHGPGRPSTSRGTALRVPVRPAADGEHGGLDRRRSPRTPSRASSTRRGAGGRATPDHRLEPVQPLEPRVAPAVADRRGVGRHRAQREHRRRPLEHVDAEHAAAGVVDVVGVAVVARAHRDDRLQRRRPARRDLQAVEPAPRDAEHPDLAAAPLLLGEPGDHLQRVVLLLREVLVVEQPVRVAAAAEVDAHARVAVVGEVRVVALVARGERVALAVREVLEDAGTGAGSSGSHSRAASRVPSDSGIQTWSTRRIGALYACAARSTTRAEWSLSPARRQSCA